MEDKKFEEKIKLTTEVEKEEQAAKDDKTAKDILSGRQEIYVNGLGNVIFDYPPLGLTLQGDMAAAQFKSIHLRKGDILTEAQLKAIYSRPTIVEEEGVRVSVPPQWGQDKDNALEELPKEIKELNIEFEVIRTELQEIQTELLALQDIEENKPAINGLQKRINVGMEEAQRVFKTMTEKKIKLLDIQSERLSLFAISLEELANLERLKVYITSCIKIRKEDNSIEALWKNDDEMNSSGLIGIRVLSLFNLFLRGSDLSFFSDIALEVAP